MATAFIGLDFINDIDHPEGKTSHTADPAAERGGIDLDHVAAMRAVIVLTPLILLAMISGDGLWLRAALVTISTFIAMERSGLAPLGTLLHGVAIIVSYLALLAAQAAEPLFVAGCAMLATASILFTGWDARLRSLGNFTLIPALYLACETEEWRGPGNPLHRGIHFLPAMVLAILPVLVISALEHRGIRPLHVSRLQHFRAVLNWAERNESVLYLEVLVATALAVGLAAHTSHGVAAGSWAMDDLVGRERNYRRPHQRTPEVAGPVDWRARGCSSGHGGRDFPSA